MKSARRWLFFAVLCAGASLGSACSQKGTSSEGETKSSAQALAQDARAAKIPRGTPQPKLPTGTLDITAADHSSTVRLSVEIASRADERQKGLMFRQHLGEKEGMLFVFPTERYNSFWMRNTLLPLDMFFIDSEWNVVGVVENAAPLTDDPRRVERMSRYVLEVNAGFAARRRLGVGASVKFEPPQTLELP
jgi:uncharacterized membrane protein (UPF0127 family)